MSDFDAVFRRAQIAFDSMEPPSVDEGEWECPICGGPTEEENKCCSKLACQREHKAEVRAEQEWEESDHGRK
jgi:hypothetical protein